MVRKWRHRRGLTGAGINKTIVVACGPPSSGRRGFVLGNHSYLGHYTWQVGSFEDVEAIQTPGSTAICLYGSSLMKYTSRRLSNFNVHDSAATWQGLQAHRGNFDAAVGTPGCLQPHDDGYPKHPFVCTGGFASPQSQSDARRRL